MRELSGCCIAGASGSARIMVEGNGIEPFTCRIPGSASGTNRPPISRRSRGSAADGGGRASWAYVKRWSICAEVQKVLVFKVRAAGFEPANPTRTAVLKTAAVTSFATPASFNGKRVIPLAVSPVRPFRTNEIDGSTWVPCNRPNAGLLTARLHFETSNVAR